MPGLVDVYLTHGWLPIVVQLIAAMVLVVAIGWRSRRWRLRWLPVAAGVGIALARAVYWFIDYQALADDSAPVMLWVWIALVGVGVVVSIAGWRGTRWWRRSASILAIPLSVLCAALTVDAWTGYAPTLSSIWGHVTTAPLPSQIDEAGAMDMLRRHERPDAGILVSVEIGNEVSGFKHGSELVYVPPAWFASDPPPPLPAVIMIGGEFGQPSNWPDAGKAHRTADEFAAAHGGNAPLLVFPDTNGTFGNDTECVNGVRGNAADHVTKEVVPYIISHFGVSVDPARWGIVGWSTGGTCAMLTTVMHPEMFSAFVDIDGLLGPNAGSKAQTVARLFGGDTAAYAAFDPATVMTAHGEFTGLAGWFSVLAQGSPVYHPAGSDGPADMNLDDVDTSDPMQTPNFLCALASSQGIPCSVVPHSGGHDFGSAAKVFADALPWLAGQLGTPNAPIVPLPGAVPAS